MLQWQLVLSLISFISSCLCPKPVCRNRAGEGSVLTPRGSWGSENLQQSRNRGTASPENQLPKSSSSSRGSPSTAQTLPGVAMATHTLHNQSLPKNNHFQTMGLKSLHYAAAQNVGKLRFAGPVTPVFRWFLSHNLFYIRFYLKIY